MKEGRSKYRLVKQIHCSPFNFFRYTWEAVDPQKNVRYEINPCGGIDKCTKSSAVCATDIKTNNSFSVGKSKVLFTMIMISNNAIRMVPFPLC